MVNTIQNDILNVKEDVAVVDFSATWCGPCQLLAPVFHDLANEQENTGFYSVDVDSNLELANAFQVHSVPTIVLLKNGKEVSRTVGFQPKANLASWIESNR